MQHRAHVTAGLTGRDPKINVNCNVNTSVSLHLVKNLDFCSAFEISLLIESLYMLQVNLFLRSICFQPRSVCFNLGQCVPT